MKSKHVALAALVLAGVLLVGDQAWADPFASDTATVIWTANTDPDLAGYQVFHGTASGVYDPAQDVGDVTTAQVPLTWDCALPIPTFHFALKAYDDSGNASGFSVEATATPGDRCAPGPPQGVTVTIP